MHGFILFWTTGNEPLNRPKKNTKKEHQIPLKRDEML